MSEATPDPRPTITEIESRQDEVLRLLDELNLRLERALADWMSKNAPSEPRPLPKAA
ncbi:MAG TPA: hypothetical protein VFE24_09780 [Pirellulales bacterium]|jgi:hypothetical protein|nr:hypothetical protein [Pirellulales bacterium]